MNQPEPTQVPCQPAPTLPPVGSNPEFDRFADLARKLFSVAKADLAEVLSHDTPNLKRDGTPKQKPGRKPHTA
ncbi:MAG: hypothetical protein ACLQVD_18010 [Capsulimonadaceae bacterium]